MISNKENKKLEMNVCHFFLMKDFIHQLSKLIIFTFTNHFQSCCIHFLLPKVGFESKLKVKHNNQTILYMETLNSQP